MAQHKPHPLARLNGRTVYLRLAVEADARQILDWRLHPEFAHYLFPTDDSLEKQTAYMRAYKQREAAGGELYYMICRRDDDTPAGCLRLHDIAAGVRAEWGSWIISDNRTKTLPVESILICFSIGFLWFGVEEFVFHAYIDNERVCNFYDRLGARRTGEDVRLRGEKMFPVHCFSFDRAAYDVAMKQHGELIASAVKQLTVS